MTIQFEMGSIDVRDRQFDHHSDVPHSQAFIAKMASVQLIEWYVMTGQEPEALRDIEFNHFGHIDDLVALTLCEVCEDLKQVQALYRFATSASVLDSCGPAGYGLVSEAVRLSVDRSLGVYHKRLKAEGTSSREASLDQKRAAMEIAACDLAEAVSERTCKPAEVELTPLPSEGVSADLRPISKYMVAVVTITDADCNIFRHAAELYHQGADLIVCENNGSFSILAASNYSTDLSGLWAVLSEKEDNGDWGGHAGAGGSPRNVESSLEMGDVLEVVKSYL